MNRSGSVLSLDSRNRINAAAPNDCIFQLQNALNSSKFELITFSFANTLYNVTSSTNTLYINGVLAATITPGFYSNTAFVNALETALEAYFVVAGPYLVLNEATNVLTWTLGGGNSITDSPMNRILGVYGTLTNSFSTTLFLVGPTGLAFSSPQLQAFSYNSFPTTNLVSFVVPVDSGYGDVQVWEPSRGATLEYSRIDCDQIHVRIRDAHNDDAVNIGEWVAVFQVY